MNVIAFVHESIAPVRYKATHRAEMVTQHLFGDLVQIQDRYHSWYLVKGLDDGYVGWVHSNMIEPVSEAFLSPDQPFLMVDDLVAPMTIIRENQSSTVYVCKGARFPVMEGQPQGGEYYFKLGYISFRMQEKYLKQPLPSDAESMRQTAMSYINVPYLWGGKTPFGADCSGFTQMLYRVHGINLKRDSHMQADQGRNVDFGDHDTGHIAFFKNRYGGVSHTGFLLSRDRIIHASGRVRVDAFTEQGIYNLELKTLTHRLHSIKNVL